MHVYIASFPSRVLLLGSLHRGDPWDWACIRKSYDRLGAKSFDIDHQTHTEPHNLVQGCRPSLAGEATSALLNRGDSPCHSITSGPCFKIKSVQFGRSCLSLPNFHLHTMPSNCFGLDGRALATGLPLPTLLSEAFFALVRTSQMRSLVVCLEHVLRGKRNLLLPVTDSFTSTWH
jgi:hypothetical protein